MHIAVLAFFLLAPSLIAEEIPRDSIIGLTRKKLRVLEPELLIYRDTPEKIAKYSTPEGQAELKRIAQKAEKHSFVLKIEEGLRKLKPKDSMTALSGFVVEGHGREALPSVARVIAEGKPPQKEFHTDQPLTVVFFSHLSPVTVRLDKAERDGHTIYISHRCFGGDHTTYRSFIALIPLSNLGPGRYGVEHVRRAYSDREIKSTVADDISVMKYVSRPFSFRVVDAAKE